MASCCADDYDVYVARFLAWVTVAALLACAPLRAHHWINAGYDPDKTFTMTGVVTRYEWKNPHALFYMEVADPGTGRVTRWLMEMGSPNSLLHSGWSKTSLRVGERVTVEGIPSRDGHPMGYPLTVTVADTGRRLLAAPRPD